ncbi:phage virion morphogenesis protein [Enterobacter roggenkampii]|uniref:phage virion morphogenesis protein n=1 Tax=Enterobacter roggenkampii TaxID=1812935 RepID=UPI001F34D149|nr:phage virion morphogenesis protein [Enterobacter roggenkampii]MCE5966898.1 phage virion morphogenesis protein [Enterobacter roggenkampii]MCE5971330.1 phage virion morphogenesis protein [Enterobacter roggenkampii]UHY21678.1 phage virion morphogenesis protein [Enterobacter roggenkampii]
MPPVSASRSGAKKGIIKREIFAKLRTNRFMKATGRGDAAVVEFAGKAQHMAKVHQYSLRDKSGPSSKLVKYPVCKLLGLSQIYNQFIEIKIVRVRSYKG